MRLAILAHIRYQVYLLSIKPLKFHFILSNFMRRVRDSNPRAPHGTNGFQDRRYRPLSQLSIISNIFAESSGFEPLDPEGSAV